VLAILLNAGVFTIINWNLLRRTGQIMTLPLIDVIQQRVAVIAISPSAARGQGVPGVVSAGQRFLSSLSMCRFAVRDGQSFRTELNKATQELQESFPRSAQTWGLARKCLNIFLRDVYYTHYLRDHFGLTVDENWFEMPLDSIVVRALRQKTATKLPRWLGVKHLKPEASEIYQHAATELAAAKGITRVHLDAYLWLEGRVDPVLAYSVLQAKRVAQTNSY
jgi:hypothetical protein